MIKQQLELSAICPSFHIFYLSFCGSLLCYMGYQVIVLIAIFNIISVISWRSVLLVEETIVGETTDLTQITDKLCHIILYQGHLAMTRVRPETFRGTCSCKSNFHMITTTWPIIFNNTILNVNISETSEIVSLLLIKQSLEFLWA